jgi:hypothetical protein
MSRTLLLTILTLLGARTSLAYQRTEVDGVSGRYLYWASRTISYAINKNGCKDVLINEAVGAVQRSFYSWAAPSCNDLYFIYDGLVNDKKSNLTLGQDEGPDHKNLVIWRTTWPPEGVTDASVTKEMPAVTTIIYNIDTGVIVDADIDLNAKDFFWTTTDDRTKTATDIQNIVTHEIGHILGLAHSKEKGSTMYESTSQGELDKRTLHADDELGVCTIYPFGQQSPKGAGQGKVPQDVQGGCSAAPVGGSQAALALLALLVIIRRAFRPV